VHIHALFNNLPSKINLMIERYSKLVVRWWGEFALQVRLLATAALVVSLVISAFTFWVVNSIQEDARQSDRRFGEAVGQLLAANAAPLVGRGDIAGLAQFTQQFLEGDSNVLYILYAYPDGTIFYGSPFDEKDNRPSDPKEKLSRKIALPTVLPASREHAAPNGRVTDIFYRIRYQNKPVGVVSIGINPNATLVGSSNLTRDVTIAVFVAVWILAILGAVFNALTITQPIKELVQGVKGIATGNFKQRILLPFGGELGQLIKSFNLMAERLQRYEEQNIDKITAEKAKLESLLTTIADGAVLLDRDLNILLANPAALHIFNWPGDVMGSSALQKLPKGLASELTEVLEQVNTEESVMTDGSMIPALAEYRATLDNPKRTVRILLSAVLGKEDLQGAVLTVQDISREVELNEAQGRFISNVSHELRTPLFNIKSFIETLHEYGDALAEDQKREFLETAIRETDRLTRLVNDVLDLSRLESGREYLFDWVDISQLIEQTLRTYQLNAKDKGIELHQDISAGGTMVWANYDLLLQVFSNLTGNALKFSPDGGHVTIKTELVKDEEGYAKMRISVIDTGMGIPYEDQAKIFDRFYRVENRVHTLEGTGLGLSIVNNIITKHNSHIELISEPGEGTTFWFDLVAFDSSRPSES
jgi:two-component system, OmpR family, sensor histidine kinase NblS